MLLFTKILGLNILRSKIIKIASLKPVMQGIETSIQLKTL
jgi:hypothetical protein